MKDKILNALKSHKDDLKKIGAVVGAVVGVVIIAIAMATNGSDPESSESDEDTFGESNDVN